MKERGHFIVISLNVHLAHYQTIMLFLQQTIIHFFLPMQFQPKTLPVVANRRLRVPTTLYVPEYAQRYI